MMGDDDTLMYWFFNLYISDLKNECLPLMGSEVIDRNVNILSSQKFLQHFVSEIEIKRMRMIEIVVRCVIMFLVPTSIKL